LKTGLGLTEAGGFDVPLEMRHCDTGELLDPSLKLKDILQSGDEVMLQCAHMNELKSCEVRTNQYGVPQTLCSDFSRKAFFQASSAQLQNHDLNHDSGVLSCENAYEKGILQSCEELDDDNEKRNEYFQRAKEQLNEHKYNAVIGTVSDLSSVIEEARLESDRTIKMSNIGNLVKNPSELMELSSAITRNAHVLDDVYKFYSGACGGDASDISLAEFRTFLTDCGIFPKLGMDPHKEMLQIWKLVNGESQDSNGGTCTEYSFTEALIRVAAIRYGALADAAELAAAKRRGSVHDSNQSPGMMFDRLVKEMIAPAWKNKGVADIPMQLKKPAVQSYLGGVLAKLTVVYKYYAQHGEISTGGERPTIDFKEFLQLLIDAGLIPAEGWEKVHEEKEGVHTLTASEVRQCFSLAQDDLDTGEEGRELTFAEFINAVARVACEKWEITAIGFMQKLEMAVGAMCSVLNEIPPDFQKVEGLIMKKNTVKKQAKERCAQITLQQKSKRNLFKYRIQVAVKSTQVARDQSKDQHSDVYKRAVRRKDRRKKKAMDLQKNRTMGEQMRRERQKRQSIAEEKLQLRPNSVLLTDSTTLPQIGDAPVVRSRRRSISFARNGIATSAQYD
jgi:hypothetical protein